ncbi:MAG: hypothetical protein KDC61_06385 [Saprospiraceae bacterium]|nr:hypothetical protein [Saprospiraceae bacterium]
MKNFLPLFYSISLTLTCIFLLGNTIGQQSILSNDNIEGISKSIPPNYRPLQINCCYPDNQDDEVALGARCVTGGSQYCVPNECPEGTSECGIDKK